MDISITTRGHLANQAPRLDTAVVVFIDPSDKPFLADWIAESIDGRWGMFEVFWMADTSIPKTHWERVLTPKWWARRPPAAVRQTLAGGPTRGAAQRLTGLFPRLAQHPRVVFACTYGQSRSFLAARAFQAWRDEIPLTLPPDLAQRNPWWAHLLDLALKQSAQA